jgi:transcription initiation factor IIE alpha subunit
MNCPKCGHQLSENDAYRIINDARNIKLQEANQKLAEQIDQHKAKMQEIKRYLDELQNHPKKEH